MSKPDRLADVHTAVDEELWTNAQIRLHHGKRQVWNRAGVEPNGMLELTRCESSFSGRCGVARRSGTATFPARVEGPRHSHWTTSVRLGFSGEEVQGSGQCSLRILRVSPLVMMRMFGLVFASFLGCPMPHQRPA